MNIIEVKNLVKTFPTKEGKITAVDKISFTVKKGEFFGLLGVNGAGKSTTLNILSGLIQQNSGKINIFGKDFSKFDEEIKSKINLATAYYCLSHNLTVSQNLNVYARLYNVKNPEEKVKQLTERFMISHLLHTKVRSLSSGEKTRLVLTKSLLNDPEVLFLDECTAGLDPNIAEITREYLKQYNKETGCTIIFTSHNMQEVEKLCQRIAFMDKGKIIKVGHAQELIKELDLQKVKLHFSRNLEKAKKLLQKEGISFNCRGKVIDFNIKNRKKIIYPLLEKFIQAKIPFDDLHLEKPTLEEYFIRQSRKQ